MNNDAELMRMLSQGMEDELEGAAETAEGDDAEAWQILDEMMNESQPERKQSREFGQMAREAAEQEKKIDRERTGGKLKEFWRKNKTRVKVTVAALVVTVGAAWFTTWKMDRGAQARTEMGGGRERTEYATRAGSGSATVIMEEAPGAQLPEVNTDITPEAAAYLARQGQQEAPVATPEIRTGGETRGQIENVKVGELELETGEAFEMIEHHGGYDPSRDPRGANQEEMDNPDAFGLPIKGETTIERLQNWLRTMPDSPEQVAMFCSELGLTDQLDSMEAVNEAGDKLRQLGLNSPAEYDQIVNAALKEFYTRFEGGGFDDRTKGWKLGAYMNDRVEGQHEADGVLHARLETDDDTGEEMDTLVWLHDKNGNDIFKSEVAYANAIHDAHAEEYNVGLRVWINLDEGGTYKRRAGGGGAPEQPATTPTTTPTSTPTSEPTPTPEPIPEEIIIKKDPQSEQEHERIGEEERAGYWDERPVEEPVTEEPTRTEQPQVDYNFDDNTVTITMPGGTDVVSGGEASDRAQEAANRQEDTTPINEGDRGSAADAFFAAHPELQR